MVTRNKLAADEHAVLTEAEHVKNMTTSDGWRIIKPKLDQRILDLQNIANLDMEKPETLSVQLAGRILAAELIFAWLKADVYGVIEQAEANKAMPPHMREDYVGRD